MKNKPEIEAWINREYTERDIETEIKNRALKKAHGNDGIAGEGYKATKGRAVKHITEIMNLIKIGRHEPEKWTEGGKYT